MQFLIRTTFIYTLLFLFFCLIPLQAIAAKNKYDLIYAWDTNLESILDYREQLEELFDPAFRNRLKIIKKGKSYGVICDCNETSQSIELIALKHEIILEQAGLEKATSIEDHGYHELFNVSYGYGPNLDAMIKTYTIIYTYLGKSVGKDLYIEKDAKGKFMLVYRRHGDRSSSMTVAKRHRKLLRKKGIRTAIVEELNNPVVYGESTFLHNEEEGSTDTNTRTALKTQQEQPQKNQPDTPSIQKEKKDGRARPTVVILRPEKKKIAIHHPTTTSPKITTQTTHHFTPKASSPTTIASGSKIETKVERYIKELRRKGKLRSDEKTGWVIYDLKHDVSLVDINADIPFQAASMIKPFIALAFFHQVRNGSLIYGPKSRSKMEAMIQRSSNPATNWVMRQVGGPANCQKILTTHYSHLFKHLRIVEYIPKGGRTYRNMALPSDYIRFLRALWKKQLPYSSEVRRLMSLPGRDRLYHGTPIPQGTLVYNKTGSTAHLCGDMGILAPKTQSHNRYPYAIVGIIESTSRPSNYRQWMKSRGGVIRQVSTLVYQDLKKKHALR